ncbi:MAG: hypothetical protein E7187_05680 [Erysipelotrichaceae bacterium]|nr:hypothetical protein [Erysipelotrichaceae bacterium]
MRKIIIVLLSLAMMLLGSCRKEGNPGKADTDTVIEDFDYDQYLIYPVSYPEPNFYPDEKDFIKDGIMDTEGLSILYSAFAGRNADIETNRSFNRRLVPFYQTLMNKLLLSDSGNNVFSPVNLYYNLAALAAIAEDEARREIYDVLGIDPETAVDDYRRQWQDNVIAGKCTLNYANSIWFSDSLHLDMERVGKLADDYFVPAYRGKTGTKDYTAAFQSWINDNTGKLLGKYISDLKLDENVQMAMASTIYYSTGWMEAYLPENNKKEVFHGTDGDAEVEMMHKKSPMTYLENGVFTGCIEQTGTHSEMMIMLLPQQGVSFEQMFASEEFQELIYGSDPGESGATYCLVDITLPKFDVSGRYDLETLLPQIGVRKIFEGSGAFEKLADKAIALSAIEHACRIKADENGLEGAAYTVEIAVGGTPPVSVDLTFDRPFFFAVKTAFDNTVFFCGIVNQV